jgi:predicted amidophosphoribosyltransferase
VKNGHQLTYVDGTKPPIDPYDFVAALALQVLPPTLLQNRMLVPVPSSTVASHEAGGHWAGFKVAQALVRVGTSMSAKPLIWRTVDIRSAASCASRDRPTVEEQIASMQCRIDPDARSIVLVDDVITGGTIMTACVAMLREAGFQGEISGIAVGYTQARGEPTPIEGNSYSYVWNGRRLWPDRVP